MVKAQMKELFQISKEEDTYILQVRDLLSETANKKIMGALDAKSSDGFSNFIVNLSDIDYINSVGINFLVQLIHRAKKSGGQVVIVHASGKVKELLDITKLRSMFALTDSVEEAKQLLSA
jgi:anti-sigma B factor antagonist